MSPRTRESIVVVGDCLRDVDVHGAVERLCPDAPAPVLAADRRRARPGGAGLTALLAARSTRRPVRLVTVLGQDADDVRGLLEGVDVVAVTAGGTTPTKTRMLADDRVLLRVDEGGLEPVAVSPSSDVLDAIAGAGVVLVSDYGRGLTADPVVREALEAAAARVPLVWDPHPNGSPPVPGATVVTPNLSEARGYVRDLLSYSSEDHARRFPHEPAALGDALRAHWRVDTVAVTAGRDGAVLRSASGTSVTPARPARGGDPCGAGDRFAATVAVALADGSAVDDAVRAAVAAAASFVAAGGAAALADDAPPEPAPGPSSPNGAITADDVITAARARGGTVVATGGCFDLLHAGHARTLEAARRLAGDDGVLVVCLNSDASVRRLKGPDRPVVAEADRVEMISALAAVDAVEVFDEDDPRTVLDRLRPDVWVKGGDYATDELLETPLVRGWGGEVVAVPYHAGRSSTRLLARLEPGTKPRTDPSLTGGTP
ncbi:PfkB family carbohydrate kinase [Actinomycetospora cinnamomea]|uniref:RfaE bifunctional protein kinase chain/domain/rfaE bifunctional protein nucleotidyltransferase chain/domain n=1 Tax=Actinomycetospora cinnamomea TaxID=663609 RepID=A0A2U1F7W2_9PSEU|nr:PfkB family carbohydrate kinase [Actinomycetospora cinnamomea]PVZ08271.1 rfaE bifunctional protein kinase chain/domain/rfaE bifunctional protein nucleotidyltransferase chain/domain [Actinomycetospora cinnamomea]